MNSTRIVFRMTGRERYFLYLTAFSTGFRANELAALRPRNFRLEDPTPAVTLSAKQTKNKKPATIPIPPAVAVQLAGFLGDRPTDSPVWPGGWRAYGAMMLRKDLEAAGIRIMSKKRRNAADEAEQSRIDLNTRYLRQRAIRDLADVYIALIVNLGYSPEATRVHLDVAATGVERFWIDLSKWLPKDDPIRHDIATSIRLLADLQDRFASTSIVDSEILTSLTSLASRLELTSMGVAEEPAGDREREIFEMLKGVGLQRKEIARRLGVTDEPGLTTRQLTPMKKRGLIAWKRGVGFYRPDCPPPAVG